MVFGEPSCGVICRLLHESDLDQMTWMEELLRTEWKTMFPNVNQATLELLR